MNEDRIYFNRASALAAEIAFTTVGTSSRELCRMQSEAMEDHRRMNEEELPFLEANGFRKWTVEDSDAASAYVYWDDDVKVRVTFHAKDGMREAVVITADGRESKGSSRRSVMDALFESIRDAARHK